MARFPHHLDHHRCPCLQSVWAPSRFTRRGAAVTCFPHALPQHAGVANVLSRLTWWAEQQVCCMVHARGRYCVPLHFHKHVARLYLAPLSCFVCGHSCEPGLQRQSGPEQPRGESPTGREHKSTAQRLGQRAPLGLPGAKELKNTPPLPRPPCEGLVMLSTAPIPTRARLGAAGGAPPASTASALWPPNAASAGRAFAMSLPPNDALSDRVVQASSWAYPCKVGCLCACARSSSIGIDARIHESLFVCARMCALACVCACGDNKPCLAPLSAGLDSERRGPLTCRGQAPCGTAPSISVPCVQAAR